MMIIIILIQETTTRQWRMECGGRRIKDSVRVITVYSRRLDRKSVFQHIESMPRFKDGFRG